MTAIKSKFNLRIVFTTLVLIFSTFLYLKESEFSFFDLSTNSKNSSQKHLEDNSNPEIQKTENDNQQNSTFKKSFSNSQLPASEKKNSLQTSFGRFQTGDYEGALSELRAELKLSPGNGLVIRNLSNTLLALGLLRIQQKNLADAKKYLEESAAFENTEAKLTLAKLNVRSGEVEAGTDLFSELLKESPSQEIFGMVTDVFLRFDETAKASSALQQWERYLEQEQKSNENSLNTDRYLEDFKQLETRREKLRQKQSALENGFQVSSSQGIEIFFEEDENRALAEKLLKVAETTLEKLEITLGKSKKSLKISLGKKESLFSETNAPHWAAAFFDGLVRLPLQKSSKQMEQNLKHELSHAYYFSHCGDVFPPWLSEGIAQLSEDKILSNIENMLKIQLGKNAFVSHKMLDGTFQNASQNDAQILYAQSFILVRKLSQQEQKWQTLFQEICVQLAPPGQVLYRLYGGATAADLLAL